MGVEASIPFLNLCLQKEPKSNIMKLTTLATLANQVRCPDESEFNRTPK
jgi:hypothetical protein